MTRTSLAGALVAAALLVGLLPASVLAADPVAVDDPGTDCQPMDATGGSFPVPEDFHFVSPPLDPDHFWLFGDCALTANDTDADGDELTYEIVTQPAHGDLVADPDDPDGLFGYDPDPNYSTAPGAWVSDSFTYRVSDGSAWSAPATMRYWVAPINDPPTFTPGGTVTVDEDSGSYSATWATDVDPGPNETDQTVHFELGPVTGDVNGTGPLFIDLPAIDSNGVLTFKIKPDVYGVAHVTFRAKDDGGLEDYGAGSTAPAPDDTSDEVTFDIVVTSDAVRAFDDTASTPQNVPVTVDVLANDLGTGTIMAVTDGALGDVNIASNGLTVEYVPDVNSIGSDTFTYTFDDGAGSTDTATVQMTITDGTIFPDAVDDAFPIAEDAAATSLPVLLNDTEGDGGPLDIKDATNGAKGSVVITGDGSGLTYRPHANAFGSDTFTYTVSDGPGTDDTATVSMTITPSNDVPNAVNDFGADGPGECRGHGTRGHGQRHRSGRRPAPDHRKDQRGAWHHGHNRRRHRSDLQPEPAVLRIGRLHLHDQRRSWRHGHRHGPRDRREGHGQAGRDCPVGAVLQPDGRLELDQGAPDLVWHGHRRDRHRQVPVPGQRQRRLVHDDPTPQPDVHRHQPDLGRRRLVPLPRPRDGQAGEPRRVRHRPDLHHRALPEHQSERELQRIVDHQGERIGPRREPPLRVLAERPCLDHQDGP